MFFLRRIAYESRYENRSPLIFGGSTACFPSNLPFFYSFYCLRLFVHRFAGRFWASYSRSSVYYYTWYSHVPQTSYFFLLFLPLRRRFCSVSSRSLLKARDRESTLKTLNFRLEADWLKVGLNQNRPTGFSEKIRRRNVRLRLRGLRSCNALNLPRQTPLHRRLLQIKLPLLLAKRPIYIRNTDCANEFQNSKVIGEYDGSGLRKYLTNYVCYTKHFGISLTLTRYLVLF